MSYEARREAWFEQTDPTGKGPGLRFECTMCGNCCTGPSGYVLFSDEEACSLAERLGVSREEFIEQYTQETSQGRSLKEVLTPHGLDCIFLDRTTIAGKAVCGVYEDRPAQCRTWPFWPSLLRSPETWRAAARTCPGINTGRLIPPEQIRILRDRVEI